MCARPVSSETRRRIERLFRADEVEFVASILAEECGTNLPFCEARDERQLDRLQFAALKLGNGELGRLQRVVDLAKSDWRDLLVAAGFGEDIHLHEQWLPEQARR